MKNMTPEDMTETAQQLAQSERGLNALRGLSRWLNGGALSLDGDNQQAALALLNGAWGPFAGTAREAMTAALGK